MERKNANNNSSIYVCYNNNINNNKVKQAWESYKVINDIHVNHHHGVDNYHDHDDVGVGDGDDDDDDDDDGFYYVDHEGLMMMAWPPRSYTCSFCKREFRSAQALGGHMNVHRRDRAQLRQLSLISSPNNHNNSSPPPSLTTPNPTSSSSSPSNPIIISTPFNLNLNLPPNPNPMINLSPPPPPPPPKPAVMALPSQFVKSPSHDLVTKTNEFEYFRRGNNPLMTPPNNKNNCYYCPQVFEEKIKGGGMIRLDLEMNINFGDHYHGGVIKEDLDLELRLGYNN